MRDTSRQVQHDGVNVSPWKLSLEGEPVSANRSEGVGSLVPADGVFVFCPPGVPAEQQRGGAVWRRGAGAALRPHRRPLPRPGLGVRPPALQLRRGRR